MGSMPIYLDHHATTPVDPRVFDAMLPFFRGEFGNPASFHAYGQQAREAVERARSQVASLLNVSERSVIFTSGATESNNLALKGLMLASPPGSHLVVTAAEHRSVLDVAKRLERWGHTVTIVPVDALGRIDPSDVAKAITPKTRVVSVIAANNEVGTLNPLRTIGQLCRDHGVLFHTDATQWLGKLPLDCDALPIDLLSASAHKLYGPKGVGLLMVRRLGPRIRLEPLFDGGGHEQHLRSGTLPVPLIVGFGAAAEVAAREMADEAVRTATLRDRFYGSLSARLAGLLMNGHPAERLPGNLNLSFEGVDGEALMTGLTGIAVSSGSACTTSDPEPSHVLRAMGRSDRLARASLRFGIGRGTTEAEIDDAVDEVAAVVIRLRELGRSH